MITDSTGTGPCEEKTIASQTLTRNYSLGHLIHVLIKTSNCLFLTFRKQSRNQSAKYAIDENELSFFEHNMKLSNCDSHFAFSFCLFFQRKCDTFFKKLLFLFLKKENYGHSTKHKQFSVLD